MSRRKFLKDSILVLGAPVAAAAGSRLYGMPASVDPRDYADAEKFKLPLSQAGVPSDLWDGLSRVSNLWDRVLTDSAEADRFQVDPAAYMQSLGLDGSDATFADESLRMLRVMASSDVRGFLAKADYEAVFRSMSSAGIFEPHASSALEEKITSIFAENYSELNRLLKGLTDNGGVQSALLKGLKDARVSASEDDLIALALLAGGSSCEQALAGCAPAGAAKSEGAVPEATCTALVICLVGAGIAAFVAAYVSVVVSVTVYLLVGVNVSVGVQSAVTVSGGGGGVSGGGVSGSGVSGSTVSGGGVSGGGVSGGGVGVAVAVSGCDCEYDPEGVSPPFNGSYAKFEPAMLRNLDRSLRLAALTKQSEIKAEAIRTLISTEVSAVMNALKRTNLLNVQDDHMPEIIDAVTNFSWKALGVQKAS